MKAALDLREDVQDDVLADIIACVGQYKDVISNRPPLPSLKGQRYSLAIIARTEEDDQEQDMQIALLSDTVKPIPGFFAPLPLSRLHQYVDQSKDDETDVLGLMLFDSDPSPGFGPYIGGNPLNLYTESLAYMALSNGDDMILSLQGTSNYRYHRGTGGRTSHELGKLNNGVNAIDELHFQLARMLGQI